MALTRKFLSAMGIEEEKIEQIISAHTEVTNALKEERDSYKEQAEQYATVKKELNELKKQTADADEKNPWKVKYDALKEEYDGYKTDIEKKQTEANKSKALKSLLKEIGINEKRIDAVAKVTDISSIKLGEDGKIVDVDKLKDNLTKEWSDFIVTEGEKGAKVATPPANDGGNNFDKMSLAEKMAYANENPNAEEVKNWLK